MTCQEWCRRRINLLNENDIKLIEQNRIIILFATNVFRLKFRRWNGVRDVEQTDRNISQNDPLKTTTRRYINNRDNTSINRRITRLENNNKSNNIVNLECNDSNE